MAVEPRAVKPLDVDMIQKEIDRAEKGSLLRLAPGHIRGNLIIDKPLTIRGAGPGRTILDGCGRGSTVAIEAPKGIVRIEDLTITGGRSALGGGISVDNGAELRARGCTIERNLAATGCGGAIAVDRGRIFLKECTLVHNQAVEGGAIFVGGDAKADVVASIVVQNAALRGGGMSVVDGAEVDVWTSRFLHNQARGEGHHIFTHGSSNHAPRIILSNALFSATDANSGLPIANHPVFKAHIVVDNSILGRDLIPAHLVG